MQSQRYEHLNPVAFAVAAGVTGLVVSMLVGISMVGMMGTGGMMLPTNHGAAMALSAMWWGGALLAALAGAVFAWIYNALSARR